MYILNVCSLVLVNMKLVKYLLFPVTFSLLFVTLYGQYKGKPYVVNFEPEEYRTDNPHWSIDINDQGIVYMGKNNGLIEFDGSNWELYTMPENMVVRSVLTRGDSIVYAGSYEEFGFWKRDDKGRMHYHSLSDTLDADHFHNDEIWRIVSHNQKIYFQSFSNIYIYNGESIEVIEPENTIVLLMKARDRLFIHMVASGLYELINDKLQFVEGSERFSDDEIKVVLPFRDDDFLIGAAQKGLFVYNGDNFAPLDKPVNNIIKDSEVNIGLKVGDLHVIGTVVNGIFILDEEGNLKDHLYAGNYLQNSTVLSLARDDKGNIWAGLDHGLNYINLNNLLDFYVNSNKNIGSVFDAVLTGDTLLVGTNQGLYRFLYSSSEGFINPEMIEGSQGQVWDLKKINGELMCGHNNGTYVVKGNRFKQISDINGGFELKEFNNNNKRYLLQSTYSSLVIYEKTQDGWKYSNTISGFLEPIPDIETDHQDYLWAAHTHKGVFRIALNEQLTSPTSLQYYGKNEGFPTETGIRLAKIENRIVFTTGELLYTYDDLNDTIVPYERLNKKLGKFKAARNIIRAGNNHYWLIAGDRIALFKIKNDNIQSVFYYDLPRLNMYLTENSPNITPLRDSLHLICLDKGFAIFDEKRTKKEKISTKVLIRKATASSLKNEIQYLPLNTEGRTEINYSYRNIEFTFSSQQYFLSSEFRYKLKGLENQWSDWQNKSNVKFTRLPSGSYDFIVQTRNIRGKISNPHTYRFLIEPPWYASQTAWIIYLAALAGGGIILRKIFLKRLRLHKQKIEREEREKREQEKMRQEQKYTQLKNEKLQNEISHKSIQLANYTMTIVRKNELLMNIKDELQKQKKELGPRYPDYYYRKLLKMLDRGISSEEEWEKFEYHFDQAHADFFKRLKQQYPELTQADLKLSAYLRLNLTSKEIAPLLNISIRGVEVRRYRLRKRLYLDTEENLVEFLLNF